MKKIFLFLVCSCLFTSVFSQTVVLEQNVKNDSIIPKSGQNRRNYTHLYIGYAQVFGTSDKIGGDIEYGKSSYITIGLRYKYRITNHEAIGAYISYDSDLFRLKQNSNKILPDTILHNIKEKLVFNSFSIGIFNRINFDKRRGNAVGTYLDLGAYGSWNFNIKHFTKDKEEITNNNIKTNRTKLDYPNKYGYGLFAQFGSKNWSIFFKKRVSNLFKDSYNYPELPRYVIGLQLGFFK